MSPPPTGKQPPGGLQLKALNPACGVHIPGLKPSSLPPALALGQEPSSGLPLPAEEGAGCIWGCSGMVVQG